MEKLNTIGEYILSNINRFPEKVAVKTNNINCTYKDLSHLISSLQELLRVSVAVNDIVFIYLPNSLEYVYSYLATSMLGAKVFPLYWKMTEYEVCEIIQYINPKSIITNSKGLIKLQNVIDISLVNIDNYCQSDIKSKQPQNILNDGDAVLLLTSGTTSKPKIVIHTHTNLIENAINHGISLGLQSDDNVLITMPLPFGYCNTSQFLAHILIGGTISIIETDLIHPKIILDRISNDKITNLTAVPSMLTMFNKITENVIYKYDLSSLKYLLFGGGRLTNSTLEKMVTIFSKTIFVQTYGQTEAGPRITSKFIDKDKYDPSNVGVPIKNTFIEIRDENFNKLGKNTVGEITVKSKSIMKGYYIKDPQDNPKKNGWLLTGDLGYIDDNNELYITGRKNNVIKCKGFRVNAEEIEDFIKNEFRLDNVLVTSKNDESYGQVPIVYIENNGENILADEVLKTCKLKLSDYKVPREVHFVDIIDKTNNGKMIRY